MLFKWYSRAKSTVWELHSFIPFHFLASEYHVVSVMVSCHSFVSIVSMLHTVLGVFICDKRLITTRLSMMKSCSAIFWIDLSATKAFFSAVPMIHYSFVITTEFRTESRCFIELLSYYTILYKFMRPRQIEKGKLVKLETVSVAWHWPCFSQFKSFKHGGHRMSSQQVFQVGPVIMASSPNRHDTK